MSTRTLTRRVTAVAGVLAATLTLATASTSIASTDVPPEVEVLFARSWSGTTHGWHGEAEPDRDVRQVEFGFRVFNPTLTFRDGMFYELPGVTARAIPENGAAAGTGELDCHVPAPGDLDSLTPEYADVHCYGSFKPVDVGTTAGRVFVVTPTSAGDRSFSVPWQSVTAD